MINYQKIIKDIRKDLGLTQSELGDKIGTGQAVIQKLEAGEIKKPSIEIIQQLVKVFNVNPYIFIEEGVKKLYAKPNEEELNQLRKKVKKYETLIENMNEIMTGKH